MEQARLLYLGNRSGEWKELVSEMGWNLGAVHDFRTTRQLEDNMKGLEQQEQGEQKVKVKGTPTKVVQEHQSAQCIHEAW